MLETSGAVVVLLPTGRGRTFGLQTLVRRELSSHVFGWVAYTLLRAERQDEPATPFRLFDFDQTHVLNMAAREYRGT